jgi:hypothetical protein
VIVVIGIPSLRPGTDGAVADGLPSRIALGAAEAGAPVQLVGKVGDDPAGDSLLIDLARTGVGHAAVLRDPASATRVLPAPPVGTGEDGRAAEVDDLLDAAEMLVEPEPSPETPAPSSSVQAGPALEAADIELGLRYLVDFRVVVAADPLNDRAASAVADAAAYAGAHVVALVDAGAAVAPTLGDATVLEIPGADPDGLFAAFVAGYAVALDGGLPPAEAFRAAAETGGWEPAPS